MKRAHMSHADTRLVTDMITPMNTRVSKRISINISTPILAVPGCWVISAEI